MHTKHVARWLAVGMLLFGRTAGAQVVLHADPPRLDSEGPDSIRLVDLDEDGADEIYIQYEGDLAPALTHPRSASGSLLDPDLVPGGTEGVLHAIGDVDLDGHLDFAICDSGLGRIAFGDGAGGFSEVIFFPSIPQDLSICPGAIADIDQDGLPDLVGFGEIAFGLGNRQFSAPVAGGGAPPRFVIDLDLDGHLDIPEAGTTTLRIHSGNGIGQFVPGPLTTVSSTATTVTIAGIIDLDSDPYPDLFVYVGGQPRYYRTLADRTFALDPSSPPAPAGSFFRTHGDLNADGVRDFAGLPTNGGTLSLLVSDPAGGYSPVQVIATNVPGGDITLLDVNGDGYDELIRFEGDLIHVYRNATGLTGSDCDADGISDAAEISEGSLDCDSDGVPDDCELADGAEPDCNLNGVPDPCDVALGTSPDADANGSPDECAEDCDGDGLADPAELARAPLDDCDGDSLLDHCAIAAGTALDCNGNGRPDACDIAWGASDDILGNGIPDECEGLQQVLTVPGEFPTIQAAIDAVADGGTILVSPGTYSGFVASARTFRLRSTDGLGATTISPPSGSAVRLSGALSHRVWIEGFTIENGSAPSGSPTFGDGGGVFAEGLDLTLWGNRIRDNFAESGDGGGVSQTQGRIRMIRNVVEENIARNGGGAALQNCIFELRECEFRENRRAASGSSSGGGVRTIGVATGTIDRCLFAGNEVDTGGGVHAVNSTVEITRSEFSGNAAEQGGGIYATGPVIIAECGFRENTAVEDGGGARIGSSVHVLDSSFEGNAATEDGGGVYATGTILIEHCEFRDNRANSGGGIHAAVGVTIAGCRIGGNFALGGGTGAGGGGIRLNGISVSPATSTSNWLHDNRAGSVGGGALLSGVSRILHDTIVGNEATSGSAVGTIDGATASVTGAIIWDAMGGPALAAGAGATLAVEHSIVEGGAPGTGNLDLDPQFADLAGRDLHLLPGSPAIGSAPAYPGPSTSRDIDGDPRQICSGADRGADESVSEDPCGFVALLDLSCTNVGTVVVLEWEESVQPDLLEIRRDGTVIAVVPALASIYADSPPVPAVHVYEIVPILGGGLACCGISCTIALPRTVFVDASGTPPGTGDELAPFVSLSGAIASPWTVDGCLLSVAPGAYISPISFLGKRIRIVSEMGPASTSIENPNDVSGAPLVAFTTGETRESRLEGFTLRGGDGGSTTAGGIQVNSGASPEIVGNVIEDCFGPNGGGIRIASGSAPWVAGNVIRDNQATRGGGIFSQSTQAVIRSNWIEGNYASAGGGGLCIDSAATIEDLVVVGNNAPDVSGGGGLLGDPSCDVTVLHCLFIGNFGSQGGGVRSRNTMQIRNSIVWGNSGGNLENDGISFTVDHSVIQGGWAGIGNIAADPQFVDELQGNYSLLLTSPCIDAGALPPGIPPADFYGTPRPVCDLPDIGPIEMPPAPGGCSGETPFRRGDCNADGVHDISDPVRALLALFSGAPSPDCPAACDLDDDGDLDIADAIASLERLYGGAPLPPYPAAECGPDPTPDPVPCTGYSACP